MGKHVDADSDRHEKSAEDEGLSSSEDISQVARWYLQDQDRESINCLDGEDLSFVQVVGLVIRNQNRHYHPEFAQQLVSIDLPQVVPDSGHIYSRLKGDNSMKRMLKSKKTAA